MGLSSIAVALLTWALSFGAGLAGMAIGDRLSPAHRDSDSRSVVTACMALVATLTALALGLLLSVANSSYQANEAQVLEISSDLMRTDRLLRVYGPEATPLRLVLRQYAEAKSQDLFPPSGRGEDVGNEATLDLLGDLQSGAIDLKPKTRMQEWARGQLLDMCASISKARWSLVKVRHDAIPTALLVLLIFWLVLLFGSFGLFAPRHAISVVAILLAAAATSGAILLIIDLETPDRGLVRLSAEPLREAIRVLGQ
jgi:hypothetical protein